MNSKGLLLLLCMLLPLLLRAQNNKNIGIGTSNPDPSAILDISSTDKGILIPRLTATQIAAINTPTEGLMVYNLDSSCYYYYNNFVWVSLCHVGTASNGVHIAIVNGQADYELGGPLTQNTDVPLAGHTLTFSTTNSGGNVGMGNNSPDPSAILDMSNGNNKGMLVPKVALTDTNVAAPVSSPATGLMVFNTNTQNNVIPGYYFWEGTKWMRIFSTNLPVVSTVSVTAPIVNTGTARDPNIGITTSDLTSAGVIAVSGGTNKLAGSGGATLDVVGANGGVLYGTGTSSGFTPAGNNGEILKSNGAAAPTWVDPNASLAKTDIGGSAVVNVSNGSGQVVGTGNVTIDVTGTQGGVMYGTGASSGFTPAGSNGQYLKSTGVTAPVWSSPSAVTGSTVVNVSNGSNQVMGSSNMNIDVSGPSGTLLYGTGTSSDFTAQGTAGEILQSNGTGAPSWVSPNAALVSSDLTGGSVVNITNGTGKVVGTGGANVDVKGVSGGILYGTGSSSTFTAPGSAGQFLKSNGAGAPTWADGADVVGGTVVSVTNGSDRILGSTNMGIDVKGTNGGVLYGTGSSSAFTPAGTAGQVLKSTGAGAPVWSSPNATLTTNDVVPAASSAVVIGNGTGQVVGGTNMTVDVQGTSGGVFYGKGAGNAAAFSAVGTTGQVLQSNGAAAPTWVNPNTTLTTKNLTNAGNGVVTVSNGTNQIVGATNATVDVAGTNGGVLYGTGASSNFTAVGTTGQVLQSNGAAAPTWVNANNTLTTKNMTNAGNGVITVTNGTNQIVGASNATFDVAGTNGGVLYGTGASSNFSAAGTSGQILKSNGAAAPTWVGAASLVNVDNGIYYNGVSQTLRLGTNPLVENTTITQAGFNFSAAGGTINLNDASNNPVNIATNSSTGTVGIGSGASTQTLNIGNGAGAKTVNLGSSNTTSTTNILSGSGAVNINDATNSPVNIATNSSTGTVSVGTGASTQTVSIANGAGAKTLNLGSTNTTSSTNINSGSGAVNINDANSQTTNINSTSSAGTVNIGAGTGANQSVNIGNGAAVKTVTLGSTNSTSTTNINSGSGAVNINNNNSQTTNINTGTNTGTVNIANAAASTGAVNIGTNNTEIVSGNAVGIGISPTATEKLSVAGGSTFSGVNGTTTSAIAGRYGVHGNSATSDDAYLAYVGTTPTVAGVSSTNPLGYFTASNTSSQGLLAMTSGTSTTSAIAGASSVWHGGYFSTSVAGAVGVVGNNNATTGNSEGVLGQTAASTGYATLGLNLAATGTGTGNGVYGQTAQSQGFGVYGANTHGSGTGVLGWGNNVGGSYLAAGQGGAFTGLTTGVYAYNTSLGVSQAIYTNNGGVICRVNYYSGIQYKINGSGTVSTLAKDVDGQTVTLHCPETPEIYFQDYGSSQLVNGRVHVEIDPTFAKNVVVSEKHPMRVFVQLEGDCKGVYVTNKTATGFDVVELGGGTSNVPFQWNITCNRADEELPGGRISHNADARFEVAADPEPTGTVKAEPLSEMTVSGPTSKEGTVQR
ncbi:MAG: hypothetical protein JSS82_16140 [Bacteroidetes bacterium]|nr:hypothetical protein [Bacteroidota bacterium]